MCAAKGRVLPAREEANRFVGGMCRAPFLSVLGAQRLCIQKSNVERFVASIPRPVSNCLSVFRHVVHSPGRVHYGIARNA